MRNCRLLVCTLALCSSAVLLNAVPSAPTNLSATVIGNTIVLQWSPPPGAVSGYYLAAGLVPGTTIAANVLPPLPGFTAFPIPPGTYYFRVHAFDGTGVGQPSNEAVAVVGDGGPCIGPPAAPVGLSATVVGFFVTLNFSPGAGGCPAANFAVHAGSAAGLSNITIANLGTGTGLSTLAPPGTYYVRVFAHNATGSSPASNEIIVRVPSP